MNTNDGTRETSDNGGLWNDSTVVALKRWLGVAGGSLAYCLSAMFIIVGVWKLMGPILATSENLNDLLSCVGTMNVYELALLAVIVLIVRWKNVTDDAVSLAILIALFLVATGITLDSVAVSGSKMAIAVGLGCTGLAIFKLLTLRRLVRIPFGTWVLLGLTILLFWNFLMAPYMAYQQEFKRATGDTLRPLWQNGWLVMLAGLVPLAVGLVKGRLTLKGDTPRSFLQSNGMVWAFALVLAVALGVHQYATAYVSVVKAYQGDFLILVAVVSVMLMEMLRVYGKPLASRLGLSLVPLIYGIYILWNDAFDSGPVLNGGIVGYPPLVFALMAAYLILRGARSARIPLIYAGTVYAIATILLWGYVPGGEAGTLHWKTVGCIAYAAVLVAAIMKRNLNLAVCAVALTTVAAAIMPQTERLAHRLGTGEIALVGLVMGIGLLVVYLLFGRRSPRLIGAVGALILSVSLMALGEAQPVALSVAIPAVAGITGIAVWIRTRDLITIGLLTLPLLRDGYFLMKKAGDWYYVLLSFVLLAAGALISLHKSSLTAPPPDSQKPSVPEEVGKAGMPPPIPASNPETKQE